MITLIVSGILILSAYAYFCKVTFKVVPAELQRPRFAGRWEDWSHSEWHNFVMSQYRAGIAREIAKKMQDLTTKLEVK